MKHLKGKVSRLSQILFPIPVGSLRKKLPNNGCYTQVVVHLYLQFQTQDVSSGHTVREV